MIQQRLVKIPNVSFHENIKVFKEYYNQKKEERRYTDIVSGAGQVYKRLLELQRAAEVMEKCKYFPGIYGILEGMRDEFSFIRFQRRKLFI